LKKRQQQDNISKETDISRKEAIKKIGLVALSATTMMLLLNEPAKGQDSNYSPENPPIWP